jgi:hypothetical protein
MPRTQSVRRAVAPAAPADPVAASEISALSALRARLPPNSDVLTRAFVRQFPPAKCVTTGQSTRGNAVLREGIRVVLEAERTLGAHPSLGYDRTRLRHLVDCVVELGEKVRAQNLAHGTTALRRTEKVHAQAEARTVLATLSQKLAAVSLGDAAASAALGQAHAAVDPTVPEAAVLEALAAAGDAWLARTDPESAALAGAHHLERGDTERARAVAAVLREVDAALRGAAPTVRDSPEVNRCEGRVILEVGVLDAAVLAAKTLDASVPELPLGTALRRMLRSRPKRAVKPSDGAADDGSSAAGASGGAATPRAAAAATAGRRKAKRSRRAR